MLVAINGPKGHGKSTAAQALIEQGFVSVSFAKPLKDACKIIFGLTDEEMEDAVLKETPLARWPYLTPRHILQYVGTDLFRNWMEETWERAFERAVDEAEAQGLNVVCPDMRFPNEVECVLRRGGMTAKVFDPRKPVPEGGHASETALAGYSFDAMLINKGTIAELRSKLLRAVHNHQAATFAVAA